MCAELLVNQRPSAPVTAQASRPTCEDVSALLIQIEVCRVELLGFCRTSDQEFSSLAQGLSRLNSSLAELRIQTGSLEAVLQDSDEDRAISSAYSLYNDSVDLVNVSAEIVGAAQKELNQVEAALVESCRSREAFEREHVLQSVVTQSIWSEASHLSVEEQSIFLNVASAIAVSADKVQICTARAFGRIEEVIVECRATRAELKETEHALHDQARKSIEKIQHELSAMQVALALSVDQSRAIGGWLAATQPQTRVVIGALQHQDIVRQQMEHVSEGFRDLYDHFHAAQAPVHGVRTTLGVEWDYVHYAARIQAAQLVASRNEIEHSGTAVIGGLRTILDTSAAMVVRFSSMETVAATTLDQCHIAELFSRELQEIIRIINQSQQANIRTARLVNRIEEIVRLSTEEIGGYEREVKTLAVNTQMAVARLSPANALHKLAEKASHVSDASAHMARKLSTDLQASIGQLQTVKRETTDFLAIVTKEKAQLERGLHVVSEKLIRLVQRVHSGSVQARREFEPVHDDCGAFLDNLAFPALIEVTFGPATRFCAKLVAMTASVGSGTPSEAALIKIKQHQSRYTMQKENATHVAALGSASAALAEAKGEDIELFDLYVATTSPVPAHPPVLHPPAAHLPTPRDHPITDDTELY